MRNVIHVKLLVAVNCNTDNGKSDMKYVQTSFTVCVHTSQI